MGGYSEIGFHNDYVTGGNRPPEEMPRSGRERIYYNSALDPMTADGKGRHNRSDIIIAAAFLALSVPVMIFNFPVGSIIGMPAFAYLLVAANSS